MIAPQANEDISSRCADDTCCSDEVTNFVEIGNYVCGLCMQYCCMDDMMMFCKSLVRSVYWSINNLLH